MGDRLEKFKSWFFKVRIENKLKKQKRIEDLSKEYDDGKILEYGKNN